MEKIVLQNGDEKIWLIKVPNYVHKRLQQMPSNIVAGQLVFEGPKGNERITSLSLSEHVGNMIEGKKIPLEFKTENVLTGATKILVSSNDKTNGNDACIEGIVQEKLICQPKNVKSYMRYKRTEGTKQPRKVVHLKSALRLPNANASKSDASKADVSKPLAKPYPKPKEIKNMQQIIRDMAEKNQFFKLSDFSCSVQQMHCFLSVLELTCKYHDDGENAGMWSLKT